MFTAELVNITDGNVIDGMTTSTVTLQRDGLQVTCEDILTWEWDDEQDEAQEELDGLFEVWMDFAKEGAEGYTVREV